MTECLNVLNVIRKFFKKLGENPNNKSRFTYMLHSYILTYIIFEI